MLHNKLLRVVQAHLLGFSTGSKFSGNAFACSACFIRLFSSSAAWSNWSLPNFPAESCMVCRQSTQRERVAKAERIGCRGRFTVLTADYEV